jgi:hypothetical protein
METRILDLITLGGATTAGGAGGWLLARWLAPGRTRPLLTKIQELEHRVAAQQEVIEQLQQQWQASLTAEAAAHRRHAEYEEQATRSLADLRAQLEHALARIAELEGGRTGGRILGVWFSANDANDASGALDVRGEADAVYNSAIPYTALTGAVTKGQIVAHLRRSHYAILEVGGHGRANAIQLADGWALEGWWRRVLRRYPVALAVLLTCRSETLMHALLESGVQCVIAVQGAIRDGAAVAFANALYEYLAGGDSVREAVELAKLSLEHTEAEKIVTAGDEQWRLDPAA